VLVVGDDDQAIFGFRKASVEFLQRFEQEFGARRVCLSESFRSRPAIVNAASSFIRGLPGRLKQAEVEQLKSVRQNAAAGAGAVRRFRYASEGQLAAHLALVAQKSLAAGVGSIGILGRSWLSLEAVRGALESNGIAHCLSHRDHHRPIHRRYPADRVLHKLYKSRARVTGSARAHVLGMLRELGRDEQDPASAELLALAAEIDVELLPGRDFEQSSVELADRLLLASRDADRKVGGEPVWLGTFHGAKGLEFDKVIVLPARLAHGSEESEERRLYYVAMTRARDELVLATFGEAGELALGIDNVEAVDLRRHRERLKADRVAYLDTTPRDVVLRSADIGRAQARITHLREGDRLSVVDEGERVLLLAEGESGFVGELSRRGVQHFRRFRTRAPGELSVRLHEIYVQLERDKEGRVKRRSLVALPTFVSRARA
jgi:ATP-dependent DNA helicase RecQ